MTATSHHAPKSHRAAFPNRIALCSQIASRCIPKAHRAAFPNRIAPRSQISSHYATMEESYDTPLLIIRPHLLDVLTSMLHFGILPSPSLEFCRRRRWNFAVAVVRRRWNFAVTVVRRRWNFAVAVRRRWNFAITVVGISQHRSPSSCRNRRREKGNHAGRRNSSPNHALSYTSL
jgi:hypothetical protein